MIKKLVIISFLYIIFAFIFLETVWGETEAGASAHMSKLARLNYSPAPTFDLRQIKLRRFLEAQDSRLASYSEYIVKKSDENKIDWRLFTAISGVESGFCKAYISQNNNCVGWGGGYIKFSSMAEQISVILKSLKENYVDQGLTSVELIGGKYAADQKWSQKVQANMRAIQSVP